MARPRASGRVLIVGVYAALVALAAAQGAGAAIINATSILPPGESGFVSILGAPTGTGSPHLYDQQQPYIGFARKGAMFDQPGSQEDPAPGVKIVRDSYGVPSVTGATSNELWWGAGYAAAEDRLFELEIFRRATTGHLAAVVGASLLPMDLTTRRDFYTFDELKAMFEGLPAALQQRYVAYAAGVNG